MTLIAPTVREAYRVANNGPMIAHALDANYNKGERDPSKSRRTLIPQIANAVTDGYRIRRLTPTECERLQGFPDGWTAGCSDTQRYKQLGNAVTVNVITAIGEKILQVEMAPA